MSNLDDGITVVIPFFQREPGLLRRAVNSVLAQGIKCPLHIIVVDDESPIPARTDIADELARYGDMITVIDQKNGGPGAARNAAMDAIPRDRQYVAFIDSDDIWYPDHLESAMRALNKGFDFFFCNLFHPGFEKSVFERERELGFPNRLDPSEHLTVNGLECCYAFKGDVVDRILFVQQDIMPSCVVYRFARWPDLRFPVNYYHSGEDELFFADIAANGAQFVFSTKPTVRRGFGVNVFDKSGWGTEYHIARLSDEIAHRREAFHRFGRTDFHRRKYREQVKDIRTQFTLAVVSRLRRHRVRLFADMKRYVSRDRAIVWSWPYYLASALLAKVKPSSA